MQKILKNSTGIPSSISLNSKDINRIIGIFDKILWKKIILIVAAIQKFVQMRNSGKFQIAGVVCDEKKMFSIFQILYRQRFKNIKKIFTHWLRSDS